MKTDREIVQLLEDGHINAAARELYAFFDSVCGVMRPKGAQPEDVKDLFQEAVLVFIRKVVEEKEQINCTIKTYITTICKYQWNNKVNKLSHRKTTITETFQQDVVTDIKDFETEETQFGVLDMVLKKVGEKCKNLLNLFYIEGKKMDEIAEIMGFSGINSAKTQKYKCIEKARKMVPMLALENKHAQS
ncbi:MAG: sigma-70 family RNA polymerase sigma factor [Bacteroidia bacterium]